MTTIWVVSTCIPEAGERPCTPDVFAIEAEAIAFADKMLRQEWDSAALEDDDGELLPYPGEWEAANDAIAASYEDGSWGQWAITSHQVADPLRDAAPAMRDALALAADWFREAPISELEAVEAAISQNVPVAAIKAALALAGGDTVATPAAPDYPAILRDIAGQMTVEAMLRIIGGPAAGSGDTTAGTDAMRLALESAEHWLIEEAASPNKTEPVEILRVIRAALGKG